MLIAGLVVLALAAVAAGVAWWQHRKHRELTAVEGSTCGELRQLADAVAVSAGAGAFRQRCELSGVARAAHVGTVTAPQTQRECVWYRTRVTHEYWEDDWDEDSEGRRRRRRVKKEHTLKDEQSDIPFALDDGTGQAVVYPDSASIDEPHEVMNELQPEDRRDQGLLDLIGDLVDSKETIGYRREEWILPVGTRLFVQGEVTDEDGGLRLRAPAKGTFRVSTRSEAELLQGAARGRRWATVAAVALAASGVVLAVAGALA